MHDPAEHDPMAPPEHPGERAPSKSQRKREAHARRDLGARLAELNPSQLESLPLPAEVRQAVLAVQAIRQRGAHRRQLQYLGKLLRQLDVTPVEAAMAELEARSAEARRRHRDLERLVEALLAGDQAELEAFIERHPQVDRQQLRQLARNAARERERQLPPKSRRALLRYLRDVMESTPQQGS